MVRVWESAPLPNSFFTCPTIRQSPPPRERNRNAAAVLHSPPRRGSVGEKGEERLAEREGAFYCQVEAHRATGIAS